MVDQPGRVGANPYVGPKPFTAKEKKHFFGRSEETQQLYTLVIARRTVLFYAQSGAGKTSLIQAALIPRLQQHKRIEVLPVSRVGGELPPGLSWDDVHNVYVLNVLLNMQGKEAWAQDLAGLTLVEGLQPYFKVAEEETKLRPRLLVLDQLEELFTTYPERYEERAAFFDELRQCLETYPQLSLLLSMREDYVASMDAHANRMPDYLRTRFRMERLTTEAALAAIREPAASVGRPFKRGVAKALVDNLSRVQVGRIEKGKHVEAWAQGRYVAPVHLQIVCQQLWDRLPAQSASISQEDVEQFADVDQALTKFYESALATVIGKTGLSQQRLRAWFSEQLITPAQTRGLVYRGEEETAGLPNAAVDILAGAYVIRPDVRGSDTWYELAHDRLVGPILEANQTWREARQNPLTAPTRLWIDAGKDPALLLSGIELAVGDAFASENPEALTDDENEYLRLSQEEMQRQEWLSQEEARRQAARRQRLALIGAALLLIVFALLAVWGFGNARSANASEEIAIVAAKQARNNERAALAAQQTTEVERNRSATLIVNLEALLTVQAYTDSSSSTPTPFAPMLTTTSEIPSPGSPAPTAIATRHSTPTSIEIKATVTLEAIQSQLAQAQAAQQQSLAMDDIRTGNYASARTHLEEAQLAAERADPNDPNTLVTRAYIIKSQAQVARREGDAASADSLLTEAANLFWETISLDADNASAYNGLGSIELERGNVDRAITVIHKSIELSPTNVYAWHDLGVAYSYKMRDDSANRDSWCRESLQAFRKAGDMAVDEPNFSLEATKAIGNRIDWLERQCGRQ